MFFETGIPEQQHLFPVHKLCFGSKGKGRINYVWNRFATSPNNTFAAWAMYGLPWFFWRIKSGRQFTNIFGNFLGEELQNCLALSFGTILISCQHHFDKGLQCHLSEAIHLFVLHLHHSCSILFLILNTFTIQSFLLFKVIFEP